jgi:hypothetical protein
VNPKSLLLGSNLIAAENNRRRVTVPLYLLLPTQKLQGDMSHVFIHFNNGFIVIGHVFLELSIYVYLCLALR